MRNITQCMLSLCFVLCFGVLYAQDVQAAQAKANMQTADMAALQEMLAQNKGKVVVVNIFATWCPPCREEIPGLVALTEKRSDEVLVIGLSADEKEDLLPSFVENLKINYPVYMADISLLQQFRVRTIPHNLVYDTQGKLVANAAGFVTEKELNTFINVLLEQKK